MTDINLPPLCPVCGGKTTLKEMHRGSRASKVTCFFRCVDCATEYPQSVEAEDAQLAGFVVPPLRPADGEHDPAK